MRSAQHSGARAPSRSAGSLEKNTVGTCEMQTTTSARLAGLQDVLRRKTETKPTSCAQENRGKIVVMREERAPSQGRLGKDSHKPHSTDPSAGNRDGAQRRGKGGISRKYHLKATCVKDRDEAATVRQAEKAEEKTRNMSTRKQKINSDR